MSKGTYSIFREESDSSYGADFLQMRRDSDKARWKGGKKKHKGKKKRKEKEALAFLLGKKKPKKHKKSRKHRAADFGYEVLGKTADTVLDTTAYAARRYFDQKWPGK